MTGCAYYSGLYICGGRCFALHAVWIGGGQCLSFVSVLAVVYHAAWIPKCTNCFDAITRAYLSLSCFRKRRLIVLSESDGIFRPLSVSTCTIYAPGGAPQKFLYSSMSGGLLCIKGKQRGVFAQTDHIRCWFWWARNSPARVFGNNVGTEESQPLSCIACPREQTVEHRQSNVYKTFARQWLCRS